MRSWCDQRNQIQTILLCNRCKLLFFLKRNIRKNHSIHPNLCSFLAETLSPIGKNNIRISHKHHRDTGIFTDFFHHFKNFICGNSTRQGTQICSLDNRSLCCRIRKRNTKFDQISSCIFHSIYNFFSNIQRWIPTGDKRDKCFSLRKCLSNSLIHGYPPLCNVRLPHSPCLHVRK